MADRVIQAEPTVYRFGHWQFGWNPLTWPDNTVARTELVGLTIWGNGLSYAPDTQGHLVPISGEIRSITLVDQLDVPFVARSGRLRFEPGTRVEDLAAVTSDWRSVDGFEALIAAGLVDIITPHASLKTTSDLNDTLLLRAPDRYELSLLDGDDHFISYGQRTDIDAGPGDDWLIIRDGSDNNLVGGSGNDTIIGSDGSNFITSDGSEESPTDGHDKVRGGAAADVIETGGGHDTVFGGGSGDSISTGSGNDTALGGDGDDFIFGGSSGLAALPDDDWLDGGRGNDNLWGGAGNDTLLGKDGNDVLHRETGSDRLFGGLGDDTFWELQGSTVFELQSEDRDTLTGGPGADRFYVSTEQLGTTIIRDFVPTEDLIFVATEGEQPSLPSLSAVDSLALLADHAQPVFNGIQIVLDDLDLILRNLTVDDLAVA